MSTRLSGAPSARPSAVVAQQGKFSSALRSALGIVVTRDLGILVTMNDVLQIRCITRHREQQRERNHRPVAQQVHVQQLADRLRIGEQDSAARAVRRDQVWKREPVEMLVDALVGLAAQHDVGRPGDLERRKIIRIRPRAQQPQDLVRLVPDFDPDRLHTGRCHVRAEQAEAVFGSEHRGAHTHATVGLRK